MTLDAVESRLERGKRALAQIDGKAGDNVVAELADIAPDFANYLFEFPFGDIYSRPGLGLRARNRDDRGADGNGKREPAVESSYRSRSECRVDRFWQPAIRR